MDRCRGGSHSSRTIIGRVYSTAVPGTYVAVSRRGRLAVLVPVVEARKRGGREGGREKERERDTLLWMYRTDDGKM